MRVGTLACISGLAVLLAGCDGPYACTLGIEPAIEIMVLDSVTGVPAAADALGTLTLGTQVIPMTITGTTAEGKPVMLAGGGEPGRYGVRIEKPGYQAWLRQGVRVESNNCGVITERFEARLQPADS